jgi:hypothetical protein
MRATSLKRLSCILALFLCACNLMGQHMNAKDGPCQGIGLAAAETRCFVAESQGADKEMNSFLGKIPEGA